ncbi:hypothetical protein Niako_3951 [Niastella koreensis GR20-10]|uniref:Uncharacterized protein n=1 Tax=Niastella koreensis (strain DSM 17620 / KACC 11465 / NBRC 106392 / GR20-10) TaxID=700598 RepID=G8T9P1_NIAKG|nr:hypothetical protein Niako_3951 [Niastella koreensis GR20-10]
MVFYYIKAAGSGPAYAKASADEADGKRQKCLSFRLWALGFLLVA